MFRNEVQARARVVGPPPATTCVHYTLDGVEQPAWVPPGTDRWDAVAQAVGQHLGCRAEAEDVPVYDSGTRAWCLFLLLDRDGAKEVLSVAVRWGQSLRPVRRGLRAA
ncbi:hypothetical protein [Muricoccus radiodurans]|uniref:hypothetical protein n=1 Tax=Muricoccus radiodurans TaxID=2231721 RepID=UPI003CF5259D